MGIVFVLALWAVAGLILAALAAAGCGCVTALLTRRVAVGRRRAIITAGLFPFACLIWAGTVFVFQAIVNEGVLNRDLGMGDTWHAPLSNGYQIMMIDVTDQGWVYNPKTQRSSGVMEQEDAVSGVRFLQVTQHQIIGAVDSKAFDHLGSESDQVDRYFILDTLHGKRVDFKDRGSFEQGVRGFGFEPKLEPINSIYSRFRFSWFDVFAGLLFLIPPIGGAILLLVWTVRLRRTRDFAAAPMAG